MVAYAVGEVVESVKAVDETSGEETEGVREEEREEVREKVGEGEVMEEEQGNQRPSQLSCYEVVTAWVHPR